ncbi:hypothetical protein phytr_11090 [Candidatus Phycorickettsia trachydisci]|uniref:Uncharacterized protein n=1 Tax=Candidatus Phycorickettsia trachydisci TaxID=2115978 RepID=A0A2P1P9S3_9RICK|nr:hypothetical protein phytr_11090 [Candidatus Phycorickettsia trachydisci]
MIRNADSHNAPDYETGSFSGLQGHLVYFLDIKDQGVLGDTCKNPLLQLSDYINEG